MSTPLSAVPPSLTDEAFSWAVGIRIKAGGTHCSIAALIKDGPGFQITLRRDADGEERVIASYELDRAKDRGDIEIIGADANEPLVPRIQPMDPMEAKLIALLPSQTLSKPAIRRLTEKHGWLDALHRSGYRDFSARELWPLDVQTIARKLQLPLRTATTLARWESQATQGIANLIPDYPNRGGKGVPRTHGKLEELIASAVWKARNGDIALKQIEVFGYVNSKVLKHNREHPDDPIPRPSTSTVRRRFVTQVSLYERAVAQLGKKQADRMFHPYEARNRVEGVDLIREFDDFDTKVYLIDPRTGLGWGRCIVTQGVDQASRFPVGLHMDRMPRSAWSATCALVNSFEAKELSRFGITDPEQQWEASGFATQNVLDNALYNSEHIVSLRQDLGDQCWARPYEPTDKREIEYLNNCARDWCAKQPGWRGAKDDREALAQGLATAVVEFTQFMPRYVTWLIGEYANRPEPDGFSPRQKYLETYGLELRPQLSLDPRRARLLRTLRYPDLLSWKKNGLELTKGLVFQNAALFHRWVRTAGRGLRVEVRYDPEDLMQVFITIPGTQTVFTLPNLYPDYACGLTFYQHKLIKKFARLQGCNNPSLMDYYHYKFKLAEWTAEMRRSGKVRERRKGVRAAQEGSTKFQEQAVHDIEYEYEQLDQVEISADEEGWSF